MVVMQFSVAIGFQFGMTRFLSQIWKPAFKCPNNQSFLLIHHRIVLVIGVLLSFKKQTISLFHRTEHSAIPQRIHAVLILKSSKAIITNVGTRWRIKNSFVDTIIIPLWIHWCFFNLFWSPISIIDTIQAKQIWPSPLFVLVMSKPSQHDSRAETDSLMQKGLHHQVNCGIDFKFQYSSSKVPVVSRLKCIRILLWALVPNTTLKCKYSKPSSRLLLHCYCCVFELYTTAQVLKWATFDTSIHITAILSTPKR